MRRVKVCLLGASAVGKTSLVSRYVSDSFSDHYRTTIGVAVHRRVVRLDQDVVDLVVWDLEGEDEFAPLRASYLRGASGCLFVADGTRPITLDTALQLADEVTRLSGPLPRVLVLNKSDLGGDWALGPRRVRMLAEAGWPVVLASAKTGAGVDDAFDRIAQAILEGAHVRPGAH